MPKGIYKRTKEHIAESISHLPKHPQHLRGKKLSKEHREKLVKNHKGFSGQRHSDQAKEKLRKIHLGKPKYSLRGVGNNNWQGGLTQGNRKIRNSLEYSIWRRAVYERDGYQCIWCGAKNGNGKTIILNADHIKSFSKFPELRFAIDNGRTLCIDCHKTTDSFGNKKN